MNVTSVPVARSQRQLTRTSRHAWPRSSAINTEEYTEELRNTEEYTEELRNTEEYTEELRNTAEYSTLRNTAEYSTLRNTEEYSTLRNTAYRHLTKANTAAS